MTPGESDAAPPARAGWRRALRWLPIAALILTSLGILVSGVARFLDLTRPVPARRPALAPGLLAGLAGTVQRGMLRRLFRPA